MEAKLGWMKSHHDLCAQRPASMLQSRITSWFLTKLEQSAEAGQENQIIKWEKTDFFCLFVCSVISSGLCIYSMFRNLWVNDFEKSKRSTRKWKFLIFQIFLSLSLSVFFPLVMHHKPHWGAFFFCQLPLICSGGSQGRNTEVVCYSLLQWTTFCQNFPPCPNHLG